MKLRIIIILAAFISFNSFSQVPLVLRPCEQQQKLPFKTVEIIDNRDEKQILGFVKVGIGNVTRLVTFDGILADTLAKFFPPAPVSSSNPKSLVILLEQLYMDENTEYTETGLLKISMRFFSDSIPGKFSEIWTLDQSSATKGFDVTTKMLTDVSRIICRIAQDIPNHKIPVNEETYTRAELNNLDSLEIIKLPIFLADKPRAGIFKDYAHFKSNTPDIETEMFIEDSRKKTNVARLYGEKKKKVWIETKGIYAVSDGDRMFKATPYGFFEIKKGARELYYERNASYAELAGPGNTYFGAAGSLVPLQRNMPRRYKLKINHRRGNVIPIVAQ